MNSEKKVEIPLKDGKWPPVWRGGEVSAAEVQRCKLLPNASLSHRHLNKGELFFLSIAKQMCLENKKLE